MRLPPFRNLLLSNLLLSLAVLSGSTSLTGCSGDSASMEAASAVKLVPVGTVPVVQESVRKTSSQPATVHAYYRAELRARVSGYIQNVTAEIGDFVVAGTPLATIDVPELATQREIARARVVQYESEELRAAAGVKLAGAMVQSAEAKLSQAQSEIDRANAQLAAIEAEFSRTNDLVARQSLEPRMLDEVRKKRDSELANKSAVESAILSAEADVAVAQAGLVSAEADIRAAQAKTSIAERQLEELDVLVDFATIKAPFSGVVTARSIAPGDLVREANEVGGGQPLFVVSQLDKVRVHIPVPERDAALVSPGDSVILSFPSFPSDTPLEASVTRTTGDLAPQTRSMLVEVELENADNKLLPGMFGQAVVSLGANVAANMLPARAVRFDEQGGAYVYVVSVDKTVTVQPVTTGLDTGTMIEVTSGVTAGQRVIDAHLKRFVNGQKVTLVDR